MTNKPVDATYTRFWVNEGLHALTAYKGPCDGQRHVLQVTEDQAALEKTGKPQGTLCDIHLSDDEGEQKVVPGIKAAYYVAWRTATRGKQGPCLVYSGHVVEAT